LVIAEGGMTEDELNKLVNDIEVQAKLRDSSNKNKINTAAAYKDIFSNYNSLSIEMIGNLATQLDTTYEDIIDKLDLKN
jgi:argininosuccinate lyase